MMAALEVGCSFFWNNIRVCPGKMCSLHGGQTRLKPCPPCPPGSTSRPTIAQSTWTSLSSTRTSTWTWTASSETKRIRYNLVLLWLVTSVLSVAALPSPRAVSPLEPLWCPFWSLFGVPNDVECVQLVVLHCSFLPVSSSRPSGRYYAPPTVLVDRQL